MSRSYRKIAIVKIKGYLKDIYWSIVRSKNKQNLKQGKEVQFFKEIVNDWDYNDYISYCIKNDNCACMRMFGRKKCLNK